MPDKKLNRNPDDKVMSPEQAIVNSAITQASAAMEIAECMNDIADNLDILRVLTIKRAVNDGIISPVEAEELSPDTKDDEPED